MKGLLLVFSIAFIVNAVASYFINRHKHNVEVIDFSIPIFISAILVRPLFEGGLALWPVVAISAVIILPLFIIGPLLIQGIAIYAWKDYATICKKLSKSSELKGAKVIENKNYSIYQLENGIKVKVTKTVGDSRTKIAVTGGIHFKRIMAFRRQLIPVLKSIDESKYSASQSIIYVVMAVISMVVYFVI